MLVLADGWGFAGAPWVCALHACVTLGRDPDYYLQRSNCNFANTVQPEVNAKTNNKTATVVCNPLINFHVFIKIGHFLLIDLLM